MAQRLLFYVGGFLSDSQVSVQRFQLTHPKLGRQHSTVFSLTLFALGMR